MSLVERQPSTLRQSNVSPTARASARCSTAGSTAASVVSTASIVAIAGESIAAPFAMPPTIALPGARDRFLAHGVGGQHRLGGVAAAVGARASPHSFGMPASSAAIGIGMPMSPVEHTSTSVGRDAEALAPSSSHMRARVAPARARRSPRWRCRS